MNREQAKTLAAEVIAKSVKETDHASLKVGDLVYCTESEKCLKIISIDGRVTTVSDKEKEYFVLVTDLASDEVVRVNSYLAIYGERCIMVSVPRATGEV